MDRSILNACCGKNHWPASNRILYGIGSSLGFVMRHRHARPLPASVTTSAGAVPEPSTWAMILLGFVGLGLVGYGGTRKTASWSWRESLVDGQPRRDARHGRCSPNAASGRRLSLRSVGKLGVLQRPCAPKRATTAEGSACSRLNSSARRTGVGSPKSRRSPAYSPMATLRPNESPCHIFGAARHCLG
jgi:PEP-CTERM motif